MTTCKKCGANISESDVFCSSCGTELISKEAQEIIDGYQGPIEPHVLRRLIQISASVAELTQNPPKSLEYKQELKKPDSGLYVLCIFCAIFIPFVGIILGVAFMLNKNKSYNDLGQIALAIGIISLFLLLILAFVYLSLIFL